MHIPRAQLRDKRETNLAMTAMIDIVFLLLIFFIMTFRIVPPEGDFSINMPPQGPGIEGQTPLVRIRLLADADGQLAGIRMGTRTVRDLDELRGHMREIFGDGPAAEDAEVEFDCDYNLDFIHTVDALTAVSGYVDDGRIVKILEKIRFARPRGIPSG